MASMAELQGFTMNGGSEENFHGHIDSRIRSPQPPPYGSVNHGHGLLVPKVDFGGQLAQNCDYRTEQSPPEAIGQPSFRERYPEGKEKLLALAEGPPKILPSNKSQPGVDNLSENLSKATTGQLSYTQHHLALAACGKPKMGLKGKTPGSHQQYGPPVAARKPIRPTPIYASEQSLPDRLSQALKGRLQFKHADAGATATVAADDVVYYPSSTGGSSGSGSNRNQQYQQRIGTPSNPNLSLSSEMLASTRQGFHQTPGGRGAPPPIPPKYSHGINSLDQLRQLYKSMPDCSTLGQQQELQEYDTPPPTAYRYFGQTMEITSNFSPPRTVLPDVAGSVGPLDEDYEAGDEGDVASVDFDRKMNQQELRNGPEENGLEQRNSLSDDSTYANIDEYRMLKQKGIMVQHNPSHSTSSYGLESSNESLGVDTRSRPPLPQDPPPPHNGSPTDSGYRSVPRHVTETQLYANSQLSRVLVNGACPPIAPKPSSSVESSGVGRKVKSTGIGKTHEHHQEFENSAGNSSRIEGGLATGQNSSSFAKDNGENESKNSVENDGSFDLSPASSSRSRKNKQHTPNEKKNANGSFDTINTNVSLPEEFSLERCPKLVELDRVPWNEKDVVTVLQRGRTKDLVHRIAIDVVPRLTYLLQRPLIRITKELTRLSNRFGKCTQKDVQSSVKIILPGLLADSCLKAGIQAAALFSMSGDIIKQSKSQRSGLRFCVGKFHRWLCDAQVCQCVHDRASVFLAAVCECLLEEIVLNCMPGGRASSSTPLVGRRTPSAIEIGKRSPSALSGDMLTSESLDLALASSAELWGLLQPYEHLISSRTANGFLCLPNSFASSSVSGSGVLQRKSPDTGRVKTNGTIVKNLEQCLLATCVGSVQELSELVKRVGDQQEIARTASLSSLIVPSPCGASSLNLSSAKSKFGDSWTDEALESLFYFMRCSQLEHSDNPACSLPAVLLQHERPYLVLPPLIDWLRVAQAHCEHRQGYSVDDDDVRQAARVLLPGLDCPPGLFEPDRPLTTSSELTPQICTQRFKQDLAMNILATGRGELVPQAVSLLGPKKLNTFNEQGLTALMLASLRGHGKTVQVLLDSGANVNVSVPSSPNMEIHPNLIADLAGWTALNFAVSQRNMGLVRFLLERGCADVETEQMCTETPLQLASMMDSHEIAAMLLSCGADPYYATMKTDSNGFSGTYGFKEKGLPAPLVLAAGHGHRTMIQLMLKRGIRGRTEEVLSLKDFLAENSSPVRPKRERIWEEENKNLINNSRPNGLTSSNGENSQYKEWDKRELKVLQEAMYHSAESGHLDVTMDIRSLGIPWNTHIWSQTLSAAHDLKRKQLIQHLLTDFASGDSKLLDDISQEFIEDGLPLLFDIFRHSKNDIASAQLAGILSKLYGNDRIPSVEGEFVGQNIEEVKSRIDPKYVNNPELSDVKFEVEGREFFAHRIVLVNASTKLKDLLLKAEKDESSRMIEIKDVSYDVFELMMEYLYRGKPSDRSVDLSQLLQLLSAARQFEVTSLVRLCAVQIGRCVNVDNCLEIYRFAVMQTCTPLQHFCEGFFLQNLSRLMHGELPVTESFRKALYSSGRPSKSLDLCQGLISSLQNRLEMRLKR